jgi:ABC-type multidrug transport system ATPase subunit
MTHVIETSGLTKRYHRVTALSDCTINVPEGRISALVGPNGAGKTTLLRLLAGLAAPTTGHTIVLGGRRARTRHTWRRSASSPRRPRCTGGVPPKTTSASART